MVKCDGCAIRDRHIERLLKMVKEDTEKQQQVMSFLGEIKNEINGRWFDEGCLDSEVLSKLEKMVVKTTPVPAR